MALTFGFGARSVFCISLLIFSLLCSATARSPVFFSSHEASSMAGRSLEVINLEDYGEPTANRGHDPSWNRASGGGRHRGRNG